MSDEVLLSPISNINNVAICLVCSNEYSPFTGVTITSIAENSSKCFNYDIIVFSCDLSENNKILLKNCTLKRNNISVRFRNVSSLVNGLSFYTREAFSPVTYFRLLIPDIMFNYDRVLYLDSDIIVNHDVAELYNIDMGEQLFAAARDTHVVGSLQNKKQKQEQFDYFTNIIGIEDMSSYFQCGVLLYNIKRCRERFPKNYLIKEATQRRYLWLDQDFLNCKAKGFFYPLENKWNVMVINGDNVDEENLDEDLKEEYRLAREDPYIVHYVGQAMPCNMENADFEQLYMRYAQISPYNEYIIKRKEMTRQLTKKRESSIKYKLTNKVMRPIYDKLFPKHSKRRKKIRKIYFKFRGWDCDAF